MILTRNFQPHLLYSHLTEATTVVGSLVRILVCQAVTVGRCLSSKLVGSAPMNLVFACWLLVRLDRVSAKTIITKMIMNDQTCQVARHKTEPNQHPKLNSISDAALGFWLPARLELARSGPGICSWASPLINFRLSGVCRQCRAAKSQAATLVEFP